MIPVQTTEKQLIESRNSYVLCHPKYSDKELHDDERIITYGDVSMLATQIECGRSALITSASVVAAISEDGSIIIDPDGNMYPDTAKCINDFLAEAGVSIDVFKWSLSGKYAVGPNRITLNSNGTPTERVEAKANLSQRESNAKLVKFYVDNVMDAVYNVYGKTDAKSMWELFFAPHNVHDKKEKGFTPSLEGKNKQKTLESLLFHYDLISNLASQPGIPESGLRMEGQSIKQSTAKRLLTIYVSSKMGVPYIPMTSNQLKKEVKR